MPHKYNVCEMCTLSIQQSLTKTGKVRKRDGFVRQQLHCFAAGFTTLQQINVKKNLTV